MSTPVPGRMRARDLDRAHTASVLDAAYAEGQLGADEYHDRIAQAGAAKTVGDLSALVDDLQTPSAASTAGPRGPAARPAGAPAGPGAGSRGRPGDAADGVCRSSTRADRSPTVFA
ncbi:DUF1707 SHOCT-like domain-containing protein, partial [Nocardia cyriacigeorgica]|uniref:DUF1707 SHOCT-like domain-containing protein n=1 Tax=Nocardia cyriacigeorgica TaxID=135487 RepID=UPI0024576445